MASPFLSNLIDCLDQLLYIKVSVDVLGNRLASVSEDSSNLCFIDFGCIKHSGTGVSGFVYVTLTKFQHFHERRPVCIFIGCIAFVFREVSSVHSHKIVTIGLLIEILPISHRLFRNRNFSDSVVRLCRYNINILLVKVTISLFEIQKFTDTDELVNAIMAAVNKFMMNKVEQDIFKAFEQSEKEVADLRQRTREGIQTARLNGKQIGAVEGTTHETQKSREKKPMIIKYSRSFDGTLSDKDCMRLIGLSNNTYYKYKRELLNQRCEVLS